MRIRSRPIAVDLTTAAATLLLVACQSASPPPPAPTANFLSAPTSPDAIVDSDPAAVRLQDIGGYVLLYYRQYQQMPPTLDELRNMPGGVDLDFNSPSSRQPFVYSQAGMWAPDKEDKCIIAYDPSSSPNGKRWCLFMMLPKGGAALSVDVVALPEPIFLNYRTLPQ